MPTKKQPANLHHSGALHVLSYSPGASREKPLDLGKDFDVNIISLRDWTWKPRAV